MTILLRKPEMGKLWGLGRKKDLMAEFRIAVSLSESWPPQTSSKTLEAVGPKLANKTCDLLVEWITINLIVWKAFVSFLSYQAHLQVPFCHSWWGGSWDVYNGYIVTSSILSGLSWTLLTALVALPANNYLAGTVWIFSELWCFLNFAEFEIVSVIVSVATT